MSQTDSRTLTPREAEVLELIAHGLTNSQVAARLDVTTHAVKFHLASIYRKLGVSNRTEAAGLFYQHLAPVAANGGTGARPGRPEAELARRAQALAAPPVLELPTVRRAGGTTSRGRVEHSLGAGLSATVRAVAAREHVEVASLVLAALGALLHRYTHVEEIVVRGEWEPLWLDVSGDPTLGELLRRVDRERASVVEGGLEPGSTDLLADAPQIAFSAGALETQCDLEIAVEERLEGIVAVGSYTAEVFERPTVERLLAHLATVLEAMVAEPQLPVSAAPLLTPAERQQILLDWNDTARPFPDRRIDELVADRAAEQPDAVAVEFAGECLTYRELDRRANGLAHLLQSHGVGPGAFVAIAVERSLAMPVGLLGILRAGGAYVPIDPAFPADRRRFMLEDANVRAVVSQERLLPELDLGGASAPPVICLDRDADAIDAAGASAPACSAGPDDVAIVIYTSGSTGKPKGVQTPHRALVNLLTSVQRDLRFGGDDVFLATTTLSFDIAGVELYLPLLAGGRVAIAPTGAAADPWQLASLLDRHRATFMQATPSGWRLLLDGGWAGRPGLTALTAGEALSRELADALLGCVGALWNYYGPTETTIYSTGIRVQPDEMVTIGRPVANTQTYVLDDHLQPVPVGVPGELYIAGIGLAHGYLDRPELTAERFVPDPFAAAPDARAYRTGDLVRLRSDGTIDYLGRRDNQVKLRGYRIELGEIETLLARQPGVASSVAITREDTPGDVRLVGYVVPAADGRPSSADLRRALGELLPAYMVPSAIVVIDELPLTPNGKIDRKALPEPQIERAAESEYVAPRSQLEERLVAIWEDQLGVSPIGVTDDFFDLGATSIVSARLFGRLERELGRTLPVGAMFRAPTVEALAQLLEEDSAETRWTSLVPIQPHGTRPPLFCVHGGAGTILHLQPLARRLGRDQPFYGLQARGLYGGAPPHKTVEEMADHYLTELRSVQPHGPYYIAGYCFGSVVAYEIAQALLRSGEDVNLLAAFNGPSPAWTKKYGSIMRQPSRLAQLPPQPPPPPERSMVRKVAGVLVNPHKQARWIRHLRWRFRKKYTEPLLIRLNREVPEEARGTYFLDLCGRAERAYEPVPYPGPMVVAYGDGLYDDPTLGWEPFVSSVRSIGVAGEHDNNRTLMAEPAATALAEHMQEVLADARAGMLRATRAEAMSPGTGVAAQPA